MKKIIKDYYKNDLLKFDKHILDKMKKYQYFLIIVCCYYIKFISEPGKVE